MQDQRIMITISKELRDRIQKYAEEHEISRAAVIRIAVKRFLKGKV